MSRGEQISINRKLVLILTFSIFSICNCISLSSLEIDIGDYNLGPIASYLGEYSHDNSGRSISGVGDVNGDGFDDLIVGAYYNNDGGESSGKTYLIFGKGYGWETGLNLSEADASFIGESVGDYSGWSVSGVGDANSDGYADFVIGAYRYNYNSGKSYLIFGKETGWEKNISLNEADASFVGEFGGDDSGYSVSDAGDVNWDGYDDFLIGAKDNGEAYEEAGKTYLIFGKKYGWERNTSLSEADASFLGEFEGDSSGLAVSGAGDVNGDGYDDILIGATGNTEGSDGFGFQTGKTYLILGRSEGWERNTPLNESDSSFLGEYYGDYSGCTLSKAGDVNDDGYDDFLIGAERYPQSTSLSLRGKTYLFFGKEEGWGWNINLSTADASFMGEGQMDGSGNSISGGGDINMDGYSDFIIGAPRATSDGNRTGKTYILFGKPEGWESNVTLSISDIILNGDNDDDRFGKAVSNGGDLNGDGFDDVIISENAPVDFGIPPGKTYVLFLRENELPEIITSVVDTTFEDEPYALLLQADDLETSSDRLIWDLYTDAPWLQFNGTTYYLNGTPENNDVGSYWVNASVMDINGGSDWVNFTLTVTNTNDPPQIITEDITSVHEKENYSVRYDALDIDPTDDVLTWSFSSSGSWLSFNEANLFLNGTPENDDVGTYWVNLTVDDGNDGKTWTNFTLTVLNVNDPPLITNEDVGIASEDSEYSVVYTVYDPDPTNDVLTWDFSTDADWLGFDPLISELSGTPTNDDVGTYWVNISISDGNGGSDHRNFTLEVENVNDDPIISQYVLSDAIEGESYEHQFEVYDIDPTDDTLTCDLRTDAGWLSYDPDLLTVSGVPGNGDAGVYWLNLTVSDGVGGFTWSNTSLTVIKVNYAPEWIGLNDTYQIKEGKPFLLKIAVADADVEDIIVYSIRTEPDTDMTINPSTGIISWVEPKPGTYNVNVSAYDGTVTIYHDFTLTVRGASKDDSNYLLYIIIAIIILMTLLIIACLLIIMKKRENRNGEEE